MSEVQHIATTKRRIDARDRERRIDEQSFREEQSMRLRELERCHADFPLERSPQMPFTDAEVASELSDGAVVERAGRDAVRRHVRETRYGVHERATRRELRTAAETRSESRAFGGGRRLEESPALRIRNAGGAHRPAVYACRRNADEEQPVEPRITRA